MTPRQEIVRKYLATASRKTWEWGRIDCAQFAAGMIYTLSGQNFGGIYDYDSKLTCAKVLIKHGGVVGITTRHLGEPSTDWVSCDDGDIVMAKLDEGDTLGVALPSKGDGEAMFKFGGYVLNVTLTDCKMFWSVPCLV